MGLDKELDRLRERFAELKDVDEPVTEDNFVTIDIKAVDAEGNPVDDLAADARCCKGRGICTAF